MSINISDSFHAAAIINVVIGTPTFRSQNGFVSTITDNGPGDNTLTLSDGLDASAGVVTVTPDSTTFAACTVTRPSDTTIRVRVWDAAGAPLDDVGYTIAVHRFAL